VISARSISPELAKTEISRSGITSHAIYTAIQGGLSRKPEIEGVHVQIRGAERELR